jgi:Family of unknown function (DUF6166)
MTVRLKARPLGVDVGSNPPTFDRRDTMEPRKEAEPVEEIGLASKHIDENTSCSKSEIGSAVVRRQAADPRAFEVQLPEEDEPHVVEQCRLPDGTVEIYCTCRESVDPDCGHVRAVQSLLNRLQEAAARRQSRGIRYSGIRTPLGCQVFVWEGGEMLPLDPRNDLRNHSPQGFEWGYQGSGPAQLALAMLADFTGDDGLALDCYQAFKQEVVALLPREEGRWEIGAGRIRQFLASKQKNQQYGQPETGSRDGAGGHNAVSEMIVNPVALAQSGSQLHETIFQYSGYFGCPSKCRLRWIKCQKAGQQKVVVIATELPENTGTSITNAAERLAAEVCRCFGIDPGELIFIEHHSATRNRRHSLRDRLHEERFDLVSFQVEGGTFKSPQWIPVKKELVESLIGRPLPPE